MSHQKISSFFFFLLRLLFRALPFVIVSSTIYDFYIKKFNVKPRKLLTAFSIISNYENLVRINKSPSVINCIDGIKVLSAIWICMGHRRPQKLTNSRIFFENMILNVIERHQVGVTSFFVCSAVVCTQSLLKAMEK